MLKWLWWSGIRQCNVRGCHGVSESTCMETNANNFSSASTERVTLFLNLGKICGEGRYKLCWKLLFLKSCRSIKVKFFLLSSKSNTINLLESVTKCDLIRLIKYSTNIFEVIWLIIVILVKGSKIREILESKLINWRDITNLLRAKPVIIEIWR